MTRSLYAVLESRCAWCDMLTLSSEAREELNFWSSSLGEYNSQPIWHTPSAVRVVYTDASDTGYGGYVVEHADCISYGQWTCLEAGHSSTWRELSAVWLVLQAVAEKLLNYRVRWPIVIVNYPTQIISLLIQLSRDPFRLNTNLRLYRQCQHF